MNEMRIETIVADVPCTGCGYNLRTLPNDGVCPECEHRNDRSVWRFEVGGAELGGLRLNTVPWRNAMRRGLLIAVIAWGAQFCGAAIAIVTGDDFLNVSRRNLWLQVPSIGTLVISYWSAWLLVTPRRGLVRTRVMRGAIVVGVAAMALLIFNDRLISPYSNSYLGPADNPPLALRTTIALTHAATIAWPVVTVLTFSRIVYLAWLSGRRLAGVLIGLWGLVASGFTVLIAFHLNFQRFTASGSEVIPSLIGPTGANTLLWQGVVVLVRNVSWEVARMDFFSRDLIWLAMFLGGIALAFVVGPFYWSIRSTITRSIRLSESLDASCPPSPSPRPLEQSR